MFSKELKVIWSISLVYSGAEAYLHPKGHPASSWPLPVTGSSFLLAAACPMLRLPDQIILPSCELNPSLPGAPTYGSYFGASQDTSPLRSHDKPSAVERQQFYSLVLSFLQAETVAWLIHLLGAFNLSSNAGVLYSVTISGAPRRSSWLPGALLTHGILF